MDHVSTEDDPRIAAVAEMLQRERPVLTFDEVGRVSRRLSAARAPRRAGGRWSRLAVIVCLSVGLLFATAGTGLAISGFASSGPSVSAQYPDSTQGPGSSATTGTTPAPRSSPTTGTSPAPVHPGPSHAVSPSSLGQITSPAHSQTRYVSLVHAETDNELPFTGFAALPVLIAGIVLVIGGAVIHRRTRES